MIWIQLVFFLVSFVVVLSWPSVRGKVLLSLSFGLSVLMLATDVLARASLSEETFRWLVERVGLFSYVQLGWLVALLLEMLAVIRLRRSLTAEELPSSGRARPEVLHPVQTGTPMKRAASQLAAYLSIEDAALCLPCDPAFDHTGRELRDEIKRSVPAVVWQDSPQAAALQVRIIEADQGNQFLRWLLPFVIGSAVLEVEGELLVECEGVYTFHFVRRANLSFYFGGPGKYMIGLCARRVGNDIARFVVDTLGQKQGASHE